MIKKYPYQKAKDFLRSLDQTEWVALFNHLHVALEAQEIMSRYDISLEEFQDKMGFENEDETKDFLCGASDYTSFDISILKSFVRDIEKNSNERRAEKVISGIEKAMRQFENKNAPRDQKPTAEA